VSRVEFAVQQAVEAIVEHCRVSGPIAFEIGYDEFDIDVALSYPGIPLDLTGKLPTQEEIVESEDGARKLAAFLLVQRSERAHSSGSGGRALLRLEFRQ
jgi:NCS2 family nucleobase:cation symporter-2